MGRGRCGGAAFALLVLTGLVGCGSPTAPIPAKSFDVYVQNYDNQFGSYPGSTESDSVLFRVRPLAVTAGDLAKIRTMNIVWPNGTMSTPLDTAFHFTLSNGGTSRTTLPADGGLPAGTYTFEAAFKGGKQTSKDVDYDGHVDPGLRGDQRAGRAKTLRSVPDDRERVEAHLGRIVLGGGHDLEGNAGQRHGLHGPHELRPGAIRAPQRGDQRVR